MSWKQQWCGVIRPRKSFSYRVGEPCASQLASLLFPEQAKRTATFRHSPLTFPLFWNVLPPSIHMSSSQVKEGREGRREEGRKEVSSNSSPLWLKPVVTERTGAERPRSVTSGSGRSLEELTQRPTIARFSIYINPHISCSVSWTTLSFLHPLHCKLLLF